MPEVSARADGDAQEGAMSSREEAEEERARGRTSREEAEAERARGRTGGGGGELPFEPGAGEWPL